MKRLALIIAVFGSLLFPAVTYAGNNSYSYDLIKTGFIVNEDSTVSVSETQNFDFKGEYHKGWRSILMDGIDEVTDISVTDNGTGKSLVKSNHSLDKTDPDSWGKYYVSKNDGRTNIEWYYDAADEKKSWTLKYKIHGLIGFYNDGDSFYIDVIGDEYAAAVGAVEAEVTLPAGAGAGISIAEAYTRVRESGIFEEKNISGVIDGDKISFSYGAIDSGVPFTIKVGWPEGFVNRRAYWSYFIGRIWQWPAAVIFAVLAVFAIKAYHKKEREGKGVIVPQYEPPMDLPPAMAEIIVNGGSGYNVWPATIIDLAVRGYLTIKEKEKPGSKGTKVAASGIIIFLATAIMMGSFFIINILRASSPEKIFGLIPAIFVSIVVVFSIIAIKNAAGKIKHYLVKITDKSDEGMKKYEKYFIDAILGDKDEFDTSKVITSYAETEKIQSAFREAQSALYEEAEEKTGAFVLGPSSLYLGHKTDGMGKKYSTVKNVLGSMAIFFAGGVIAVFCFGSGNPLLAVAAVFATYFAIAEIFGLKWTSNGKTLREDWLGFKLYLATAEKYRLQNLTPDTFEKFLPYAMIFGVEKEWAKAFEGMTMSNPSWYSSSIAAGTMSTSGGMSSFSPTGFSNSFSSSFSSAFSSATGTSGGSSSSGGSSGGGGGGGGGGAS